VGAAPGLRAELGLLPEGVADFTWTPGAFAGDLSDGDVYTATLLPETAGVAIYKWRFSTNQGADWVLSDSGQLTTLPNEDTEAPKAPFRMDPIGSSPNQVSFAWRVSRPRDLAFYRICRADLTAGEEGCATQVDAPKASNIYTDTTVTTGHTYSYTVSVVDTAFNQSPPSAAITRTAELSVVDVTFRMLAPAETPADAQIYLAGDNPDVFGAPYDPARLPMTNLGDGLWEVTVQAKDGAPLLYKYTRGSWERVEQWGTIAGYANRQVTVAKSPENTMLIEDTATDWGSGGPDDRRGVLTWRDPLVKEASPTPGSAGPVDAVRATFSVFVSAPDPQAVIAVADATGTVVEGAVTAEGADTFVWTPAAPLAPGDYTATAFNVEATTPMVAPFVWEFTVQ
jgi:alpha-glucosidase